jgi:SlyX protein
MTKALEEQIAHLTCAVEDLSDVVAKQDIELRQLTQLVDHLAKKIQGREPDSGSVIFSDERPPHY